MDTRIKEIRKKSGLSQQAVADKLGIHLTNYNKMETGKTRVDLDRLEQLASIFACDALDLLIIDSPLREVKVVAYVQAGAWAESNELDEEDQYTVAIPNDDLYRELSLTAAEVRGPSMNRRYPEGTVLVITNAIQVYEEIEPGKRYIVERERADGMREYTVKTLHRDESGQLWLMPESDDPRFQQPIEANGELGDTIRILGRVAYSLQRE